MMARLAPEEADGRIGEMVAEFRRRRLPLEWTIGSAAEPGDLGPRLERQGFEQSLDVPGMAMLLGDLPDVQLPRGLRIDQVRTRADLETCLRIALTAFGITTAYVPRLADLEEGMPLEQRIRARHYLARLDGRPVATAELFLGEASAGLYFVGTLEEVRGRGFGRAVTLTALREAHSMGFRVGTLQATAMGERLYRRLGFREQLIMSNYLRT